MLRHGRACFRWRRWSGWVLGELQPLGHLAMIFGLLSLSPARGRGWQHFCARDWSGEGEWSGVRGMGGSGGAFIAEGARGSALGRQRCPTSARGLASLGSIGMT
jgi:hypothetical protein